MSMKISILLFDLAAFHLVDKDMEEEAYIKKLPITLITAPNGKKASGKMMIMLTLVKGECSLSICAAHQPEEAVEQQGWTL